MSRRDTRRGGSWAPWSLSILLHLAIVAVVAGAWFWSRRTQPAQRLAIEGSVVSTAQLAEAVAPPPVEPPPEPLFEPEPETEPEPEPLPPEEDPAQMQAEP